MQCGFARSSYLPFTNLVLCGTRRLFRYRVAERTCSTPTIDSSSNRCFACSASLETCQDVPTLPSWDLRTFCERAFVPKIPALLPQDVSNQIPAAQSWLETKGKEQPSRRLRYDYLRSYEDAIVPLELTRKDQAGIQIFERFQAPLKLFLDWMQNQAGNHPQDLAASSPRLYLAQCQISDLPGPLQADLTTPDLVLKAGRGDVYDANIWIGTPPTYTPLHRDPNPNFFLQLSGTKIVRLFPPALGRDIFGIVQEKLGKNGSAAFRGEEMMQGEERELLEREVWEDERAPFKLVLGFQADGYEATVKEGNALFIPLGWWHSIKSIGTDTTASVNWWFR